MPELTFLMHADPPGGSNPFYALARQYFVAAGATVIDAPADKVQTLQGIFAELAARKVRQGTINLVSHAVGFGAIEGALTDADRTKGSTFIIGDALKDALAAKSLAPPGPGIITDKTRIVLYGCDVGRSEVFLRMLAALFGSPGELLAPRRLSVFRQAGSSVKYRQAQSWSLARRPPLLLPGAAASAAAWKAYRTQFVEDASLKFGRIAIPTEPVGVDRLKDMLTAAASGATTATGATFFLQETYTILPVGSQTAAEAAASIAPISNGDPIKALAKSALELDDTTVITTVGPADAFPTTTAATQFAIAIVILAQVIEEEVLIAEGPGYARVTTSPAIAPSPGPAPTGGGSGSGSGSAASAFDDDVRELLDELLADGAPQADVDAIIAAIPQGDATAGVVVDVPDAPPIPDDIEYRALPPEPEEVA